MWSENIYRGWRRADGVDACADSDSAEGRPSVGNRFGQAAAVDVRRARELRTAPRAARAGRVTRSWCAETLLQLPELQDLEENVVRVEDRNQEPGGAVTKPAPHDVVAQERRGRMDGDLERIGSPSLRIPFLGGKRRVVIDAGDVIRDVAIRVVLEVVMERARTSLFQLHRLVHALAVEAADTSIVEPQLIVGIPIGSANPAAQVVRHARHAIAAHRRPCTHDLLDLGGELRRNPLVGVDRQDPVVGGDLGGVVALRAVARPVVDDDAGRVASGERHGLVRTVRVDDHDFVGPFDGFERPLDVGRLVSRDDRHGQLHTRECSTRGRPLPASGLPLPASSCKLGSLRTGGLKPEAGTLAAD